MQAMQRASLALIVLLSCACGKKSDSGTAARAGDASPAAATGEAPADHPAAIADAAMTADAAIAAAEPRTGDPVELELSAKGIGQLSGAPMTLEGLTRALPGYNVELVPEGEYQEEHFLVKAGEESILEIRFSGEPGQHKLRSVDVVSPRVGTDLGVAIGSTHADAIKVLGKLECTDGGAEADWREALVVCVTHGHAHLVFEFMDVAEDGTPRRPASEVLEDKPGLAASKLVTITWSPR